jgi:hypothetical protein
VFVFVAAALVSRGGGAGSVPVFSSGAAGALIQSSDLGDTWSDGGLVFDLGAVPTSSTDPNALAGGSCGSTAADPTSGSVASRSATFNAANKFMSDAIGVFPSANVAHERYAAYRAALNACSHWTATTSGGGQLALRLDPVTAPKAGDESAVYHLVGNVSPAKSGLVQSTSVEAAVVVMRRLNAVSVVAEMSIGYLGQAAQIHMSEATSAAALADAKLARQVTVPGPLSEDANVNRAADEPGKLARSSLPEQGAGIPIGTSRVLAASDGGKVAVTVLGVVDPAIGLDGYTPKTGYRFVGVQLRLANIGTQVYDDSPENGALLIDDRGEQHYADLAEITAGDGFGGHVRLSGEDNRVGYVVFQVAQGTKPRLLQFALDSGFAPSMGQWSLSSR